MCHCAQQHSALCLKTLKPQKFGGGRHHCGLPYLGHFLGKGPSRITEQPGHGVGVGVRQLGGSSGGC